MQLFCIVLFDNVLLNRSLYILELENWIAQIESTYPAMSSNPRAERNRICKSLLSETSDVPPKNMEYELRLPRQDFYDKHKIEFGSSLWF